MNLSSKKSNFYVKNTRLSSAMTAFFALNFNFLLYKFLMPFYINLAIVHGSMLALGDYTQGKS